MVKKYINTFTIGLLLFILFIVQYSLPVKWEGLRALQQEELFKRWSGLMLALVILFQWLLTFFRVKANLRKHSIKMTTVHKWLGAFSPLFFYIHSMDFGYAYLALLSVIFMGNMLIGTINLDIVKSQKEWIFQLWMITHVSFSVIITFIMLFHIGVVFYYK